MVQSASTNVNQCLHQNPLHHYGAIYWHLVIYFVMHLFSDVYDKIMFYIISIIPILVQYIFGFGTCEVKFDWFYEKT